MVTFDLTQTHFIEWQHLIFKNKWLIVHSMIGAFGFLILVFGVLVLLQRPGLAVSDQVVAQSLPLEKIQVYISGAVQQPGVYSLQTGQRLSDVLTMAGGLSGEVDPQALNNQLNLATKVVDGEHIHIPLLAESMGTYAQFGISASPKIMSTSAENKVSLNLSTLEELMSLPQIGEKRAADIVAGRPYVAIDELLSKEIVTEKMYEAIKDLVAP